MEFDPITGAYIENIGEKDSSQAEEINDTFQEETNLEKKQEEEKSPKINRKVIIICIVGILCFLMILRLFKGNDSVKSSKKERKQAQDLIVPDFGYHTNSSPENTANIHSKEKKVVTQKKQTVEEKYKDVPAVKAAQEQKKQINKITNEPKTALSEEELNARASPISVSIKKDENNYTTYKQGLNQPNYGISQNDYVNQRLSSLPQGSQKTSYEIQNMQDNKQAFYRENQDSYATGYYVAKDTIWTGSIIPAVLLTGITTDGPGQIKAQVTENVFDSLTGKTLLIPQGTILIAEYNSSISYAQKRVQIAWNTLIRPDGYQLNLGNMNGVDKEGYSGIGGRVSDHFFEYVKAMGVISAFTLINGEFDNQLKKLQNEYAANMLQQNQTVINQLGAKMIDRALDIQPTIFVKNGQQVNIFVNKNISLPPFKN